MINSKKQIHKEISKAAIKRKLYFQFHFDYIYHIASDGKCVFIVFLAI